MNNCKSICEDDDDVWPPGFRFHPTDEELILYYLKRKICRRRLKLDILAQIDVYKFEPHELPGLSLLKNGDRLWFYFSPRDRKYPNGSRSNRATREGYWKATGKDRTVTCNSRNVGVKKTLVFYKGRAPTGARTDWVMHEYTLDEDELKRCQNAQDYYAVYKLFKKSGPGPKNGEQYGAPFKEEDWVDDDRQEITRNNDLANHVVEVNNALAKDSCRDEDVDSLFDDIEEIMNRIVSEFAPAPAPQPADVNDLDQALSQFVAEEEIHSTMVNSSFGEVTYAEPSTTYGVSSQQNGLEASFDVSPTTTSGLLSWDVPEVTSNVNIFDLPPVTAEEDFLEMDDLLGPGPVNEFDIFYGTDIGAPKSQEGGWVNNHVGYQPQPYQESASYFDNEMWSYDQNTCLPILTPTHQQANPGVVLTGVIGLESNQTQRSGKEQVEVASQPQPQPQPQTQTQTWFSSTLWSFVESIPAAPASAAESALMNKAFQRMSSFSRLRISAKSTTITSQATSTAKAGVGGSSRIKSLFLFSFFAALFAVLCVFIGSNVSGFGKLHRHMSL